MAINSKEERLARLNVEFPYMAERLKVFAVHFVEHQDMGRAYLESGLKAKTPKVATMLAGKLLAKISVKRALVHLGLTDYVSPKDRIRTIRRTRRAMRKMQKRDEAQSELTSVMVLEQLRRLIAFDVTDIYDAQGQMKPLGEWSREARTAVDAIENGANGRIAKVTFASRIQAIKLAMNHLNLLKADQKLKVALTLEGLIRETKRNPLPPMIEQGEPVRQIEDATDVSDLGDGRGEVRPMDEPT